MADADLGSRPGGSVSGGGSGGHEPQPLLANVRAARRLLVDALGALACGARRSWCAAVHRCALCAALVGNASEEKERAIDGTIATGRHAVFPARSYGDAHRRVSGRTCLKTACRRRAGLRAETHRRIL